MVILFDDYVKPKSEDIIYHLLTTTSPMFYQGTVLATLLQIAQSPSKNDVVTVTRGIHTNWEFVRGAKKHNQFVAFWFDVTASAGGKQVMTDDNHKLHIYIGKYELQTDNNGNQFWNRVEQETSPEYGYGIPEDKKEKTIVTYIPSGRVTGSHIYDEEIKMYGGSKK